MSRPTILLAVLAIPACTPTQPPITTAHLPAITTPRDTIPHRGLIADSAAAALGLAPLATTPLPNGVEEIRIWVGGGLAVESDLFRLIRKGGNVDGLVALYWRIAPPPEHPAPDTLGIDSLVRYSLAGQCGPFRRDGRTEACQFHLTGTPDWRRLWDSLVTLGAWTLPDESMLPRDNVLVYDGWIMTVEVRDGARYRSYEYDNPNAHKGADYEAAVRVADVTNALQRLIAPRTNETTLRGRLDIGRYAAELTPCGSATPWGLLDLFAPVVDSVRATTAVDDSVTRRTRYAVVRGEVTLPARLRQRQSPYVQALDDAAILELRDWTSHECDPTAH